MSEMESTVMRAVTAKEQVLLLPARAARALVEVQAQRALMQEQRAPPPAQ